MKRVFRWVGLIVGLVVLGGAIAGTWIWNDRPDLTALGLPVAEPAAGDAEPGVTVQWLGVTTLLFDDGETQLLTDGFFSRPGPLAVLLDRPIAPDTAGIDRALAAAGITQLAAVMTVHSHYDHAMDTGEVAKRSGAMVLGSASTAQVARGAGVVEDHIIVMADGDSRQFGQFTVTFIRSRHWPTTDNGDPPMPGTIDAPLVPPAPLSAWREGGSYSIVIAHPRGSALVQGSAGYVEGALAGRHVDAVFLGLGGLAQRGPAYTAAYWREIVGRTHAARVFPVHYDDFTRPYGDVRPFPRRLDDAETALEWLSAAAAESGTPVQLELLPFRQPVHLF